MIKTIFTGNPRILILMIRLTFVRNVVLLLLYTLLYNRTIQIAFNTVVLYNCNDIIIMCILTFWLSASFLSLAHTCFCATYARACELFLFDIIYFYFRPSLVACPVHYFPSPEHSAQTGFIYSRPGISRALRRLCPKFFFYHHSARVSLSSYWSVFFFF